MSTPSNEPTNPYSQGAPSYDSGSFNQPPQFHGQTPAARNSRSSTIPANSSPAASWPRPR